MGVSDGCSRSAALTSKTPWAAAVSKIAMKPAATIQSPGWRRVGPRSIARTSSISETATNAQKASVESVMTTTTQVTTASASQIQSDRRGGRS